MLQLLKNLRSRSQGKEITDAGILKWANDKVKSTGRTSQMESFKDKSLSNGLFFLELLSSVEPRVVNWNLVTKGESDEEKRLNATYIISVARKLGCSIFLLPEDIMEVNQKMILTLTASIMYWSLQQQVEEAESSPLPSPTNGHSTTSPDASPVPSPANGRSTTTRDASPIPSPANGYRTTTPDASLAPSPANGYSSTTPDASPAPSVSGEDEISSLSGDVSNLTIDDAASDTTMSSQVENADTPVV